MKSGVSAEELAKIAGVKATTVRKTAHELFELLERDLKSRVLQSEMSAAREQGRGAKEGQQRLEDWEPVHDSVGVTRWLPARRCLNSDD